MLTCVRLWLDPKDQVQRLTFATLLLTMLSMIAGCSRIYTFEGAVVDGDGNPIAGASIILYPHHWKPEKAPGEKNEVSSADGSFEAHWGTAVDVEYFYMVVSKDGYRDQKLLVKANEKDLRVVMERVAPADPSAVTKGEMN